jgi:hypothetical protein
MNYAAANGQEAIMRWCQLYYNFIITTM